MMKSSCMDEEIEAMRKTENSETKRKVDIKHEFTG